MRKQEILDNIDSEVVYRPGGIKKNHRMSSDRPQRALIIGYDFEHKKDADYSNLTVDDFERCEPITNPSWRKRHKPKVLILLTVRDGVERLTLVDPADLHDEDYETELTEWQARQDDAEARKAAAAQLLVEEEAMINALIEHLDINRDAPPPVEENGRTYWFHFAAASKQWHDQHYHMTITMDGVRAMIERLGIEVPS